MIGLIRNSLGLVAAVGSGRDDAGATAEQRVQSKGASLAVMVSLKNDEAVLEHADEGQEPEEDGSKA